MVSFGGVFYPTGYVFLMFPTAEDAQEATARLVKDGYDEEAITLLTPQLIQEQLPRVDGHASPQRPTIAMEAGTVRRFVELAEQGHHALMLHAPTCCETGHIMDVLQGTHISCGQKYRPANIEDLARTRETVDSA